MSKTEIYICAKYNGKIIHARQVDVRDAVAEGVIDIITKAIDHMADTLITAERKRFF